MRAAEAHRRGLLLCRETVSGVRVIDLLETFTKFAVRGGEPQGIFAVRLELLVPFAGEWAA